MCIVSRKPATAMSWRLDPAMIAPFMGLDHGHHAVPSVASSCAGGARAEASALGASLLHFPVIPTNRDGLLLWGTTPWADAGIRNRLRQARVHRGLLGLPLRDMGACHEN